MAEGATPSQAQAAIAPGSTPQGGRPQLEGAIAEALGGGGGAPAAGAAQGAAPEPQIDSPLGAMLGGLVKPQAGLPVTDGMSVGPGASPQAEEGPPPDKMAKLQFIAQNAKTPHLRAMARNALRRLVRAGELL